MGLVSILNDFSCKGPRLEILEYSDTVRNTPTALALYFQFKGFIGGGVGIGSRW